MKYTFQGKTSCLLFNYLLLRAFFKFHCYNNRQIMTSFEDNIEVKTSSTVSENASTEEASDTFPSNLNNKELLLAINKEATEEELTEAIDHCKDLILSSDQCSIERKWLVRHLIELRLRRTEVKDAMEDPTHPKNKDKISVSNRIVMGHHLKLQPLLRSTTHRYCDHCTGTIWSVVQAWYECQDCNYSCHHKCMASIIRECAHVVTSEKGEYELNICPENGISAQKYLCAECKAPLVLNREWTEARRCDYNGLYYCSACHWGSSAIVPARVVHNWDLSPQSVCQASLQQLRVTANKPLINLEKLNPKLFSLVHELSLVKRLRQELVGLRKYLLVCRQASDHHLLWKCDRPYLIETTELYSLQDLVDTHFGELPSQLHNLVDLFTKHVKIECEVCKGRGHICEICLNVEILYPFDASAHVCDICTAVFHKQCFARKSECPKCARIKARKEQENLESQNNNV